MLFLKYIYKYYIYKYIEVDVDIDIILGNILSRVETSEKKLCSTVIFYFQTF